MAISNGTLPEVTVALHYPTRKGIVQAKESLDLTTRGGRMRAAREAAGLSTKEMAAVLAQRELGERSDATVNRYENNQKAAPLEYVELLAELSGYSLDWIVLGVGNRGSAVDVIRRLQKELGVVHDEYVTFYEPATVVDVARQAAAIGGTGAPEVQPESRPEEPTPTRKRSRSAGSEGGPS